MAGRSRRFSTISVEEKENRGSRIQYISEKAALRPVSKDVDPDDWDCFVLEDTTIYTSDGKTIANLLHAEIEGTVVVRGKLLVDADLRSRLVSKKYNGQYIEISNCQGFSIGSDPITIWAMGQSGWLEIRPSETYQKMYKTMADATSIYYFILDLYEEMKQRAKMNSKKSLTIDEILLKYACFEGTGLVRSETVDRMKAHAKFLLSQMRKPGSINWKSTTFFKWLSGQCQEVYAKLLERSGETALSLAPIELAVLPPPGPQSERKLKTLPNHTRIIHPPILPPPRLSLRNAIPTINEPKPESVLSIILALLHEADTSGHTPRARMTLSKAGTLLYYTYSIKSAPLAQEIMRLHAKSIASSLSSQWKTTPIYTQLLEIASQKVLKSDLRTQAINTTEIKKRREAASFRRVPGSTSSSSSSSRIRTHRNGSSPEPHASKTLLPPQSGRRSGKEAGLRLASTPAMKRDNLDRDSSPSSEDNSSRPRKRRRPSPPEMGDDSDEDVASSPPPELLLSNFSQRITDDKEAVEPDDEDKKISLHLVSAALPTLDPTGPNGMWSCDREDCFFIVRDAESEKCRERIREHFNYHADQLEREALVRQEAAQRRLPIGNLLEKLKTLGERARLADKVKEEREMIGDRIVPICIKRSSSMGT